jgi:hypothetical protein
MKAGKVFLFAVERIFDVLDLIALVSDRRKEKRRGKDLTLEDLLRPSRDGDLLRRTQAPTMVIPPPSERGKRR